MASERRWQLGDLVRKKANSEWRGVVVGFYSTEATPEGYSVKSLFEKGSVQVWPLAALEDWDGTGTPEALTAQLADRDAEIAAMREALGKIGECTISDQFGNNSPAFDALLASKALNRSAPDAKAE